MNGVCDEVEVEVNGRGNGMGNGGDGDLVVGNGRTVHGKEVNGTVGEAIGIGEVGVSVNLVDCTKENYDVEAESVTSVGKDALVAACS